MKITRRKIFGKLTSFVAVPFGFSARETKSSDQTIVYLGWTESQKTELRAKLQHRCQREFNNFERKIRSVAKIYPDPPYADLGDVHTLSNGQQFVMSEDKFFEVTLTDKDVLSESIRMGSNPDTYMSFFDIDHEFFLQLAGKEICFAKTSLPLVFTAVNCIQIERSGTVMTFLWHYEPKYFGMFLHARVVYGIME